MCSVRQRKVTWHFCLKNCWVKAPGKSKVACREAKQARQKQRDKEIALLLAG